MNLIYKIFIFDSKLSGCLFPTALDLIGKRKKEQGKSQNNQNLIKKEMKRGRVDNLP